MQWFDIKFFENSHWNTYYPPFTAVTRVQIPLAEIEESAQGISRFLLSNRQIEFFKIEFLVIGETQPLKLKSQVTQMAAEMQWVHRPHRFIKIGKDPPSVCLEMPVRQHGLQ